MSDPGNLERYNELIEKKNKNKEGEKVEIKLSEVKPDLILAQ